MERASHRGPRRSWLRVLLIAALLAVPVAAVWNLLAARLDPSLALRFGQLAGVTAVKAPPGWSLSAFAARKLQDWVGVQLAEAMPFRPALIRLNNEARYGLFGAISAPDILEGEDGYLTERRYITEYCSRTATSGEEKAAEVVPKLQEIQAYFRERNRIFFYLITPSKVATLPEKFFPRFPCANAERERAMYLPALTRKLEEAGIAFLDTASLIHEAGKRPETPVFPRRGIHWNNQGVAIAASAIVDKINALAGREIVPPMRFTVEYVDQASGMDLDLEYVLNLANPRTKDRTPVVRYQTAVPCEGHPATRMDAAMVGSSFIGQPGGALIYENCLKKLERYHYLSRLREGIDPAKTRQDLSDAELAPIRDSAEIVILEENESFREESNYVPRLLRLLKTGRTAAAN